MARLSYGVAGEEVGSVRCDGLVVCTPAGSTGYNLANGGPVLAWGVEGFGVSFIAPHSLTARALVVAPTDVLTVSNQGREAVDVSVDGRPVCEIAPGEDIDASFETDDHAARATAGVVVLQAAAGEVRPPVLVVSSAVTKLPANPRSVGRRC